MIEQHSKKGLKKPFTPTLKMYRKLKQYLKEEVECENYETCAKLKKSIDNLRMEFPNETKMLDR